MSNRYLTLALFGIVCGIFLIYLWIQKATLPSGQPIQGLFQGVIQNARQNQWPHAVQKAQSLIAEWEKRKYFIMLNYSEADYQVFENTIYELAAAAQTKDKYETISRAQAGRQMWQNFLKLIPAP